MVLHWDLYGWDEDQVSGRPCRALPSAPCGPHGAWDAGVPVWQAVPRLSAAFPPQEEMALELINCPDYKLRPHQHSYLRSTAILTLCLLMVLLGGLPGGRGGLETWAGDSPPEEPPRRSAS